MKPKTNRKEPLIDRCQTPAYAIEPLLPYLLHSWTIWESASGEGLLAKAFRDKGFDVISTDIIDGHDFFIYDPGLWMWQITNPPYSLKYKWLARSYELDKPFALLMPVEMMGAAKAQYLFGIYGITVMVLNHRVNFKMPNKGWSGSGAQFPVAWYIWQGYKQKCGLAFGRINVP